MNRYSNISIILVSFIMSACKSRQNQELTAGSHDVFPKEMVEFVSYEHNPIFIGTSNGTWDDHIRERGYILVEDGIYKMWYTGYLGGDNDPKSLGHATSADGIHWVRNPKNPIFSEKWTEDMFVVKNEDSYYMFAEGKNDIAHMLTSDDGIKWMEKGDLTILSVKGDTVPGPFGTPAVWIENGKWYLFYERNDEAIWLAESTDLMTWKNLQDEPVLQKGPESYDAGAVAANQIIRFKGKYFMYYHGSSNPEWDQPGATSLWTSNVAMSSDLIHWIKYPKNPIVEGDHSSPIMVYCNGNYRLYTMHHAVWLYYSK